MPCVELPDLFVRKLTFINHGKKVLNGFIFFIIVSQIDFDFDILINKTPFDIVLLRNTYGLTLIHLDGEINKIVSLALVLPTVPFNLMEMCMLNRNWNIIASLIYKEYFEVLEKSGLGSLLMI
ncbi:hypothetical protein BpHYR1_032306 [Brachionus plicatilis]|uniref:Uncharacterized protein n=1 Tax=Brachionus plicatilis TaxID=10195 RepID=A0A3M7Q5S8_BRAPC|nr:hypothetical protein BpHYR1_032306 [Brachionus plicatilis]